MTAFSELSFGQIVNIRLEVADPRRSLSHGNLDVGFGHDFRAFIRRPALGKYAPNRVEKLPLLLFKEIEAPVDDHRAVQVAQNQFARRLMPRPNQS